MNDLITIFKALSDETRLRIVKLLERGELCVCDITAALNMAQPKVSFHLGVLREAGLIKDRKEGRWIHCRLDESEVLRRMLLLTVCERVPETTMVEDRARLARFLDDKKASQKVVSLRGKLRRCG